MPFKQPCYIVLMKELKTDVVFLEGNFHSYTEAADYVLVEMAKYEEARGYKIVYWSE